MSGNCPQLRTTALWLSTYNNWNPSIISRPSTSLPDYHPLSPAHSLQYSTPKNLSPPPTDLTMLSLSLLTSLSNFKSMINYCDCSPDSLVSLALLSLCTILLTKSTLYLLHATEYGCRKAHHEWAYFKFMTLHTTKLSYDITKPHVPYPFSLQNYYFISPSSQHLLPNCSLSLWPCYLAPSKWKAEWS